MSKWKIRTCHSDFLRILRCLYGAPYDSKALWINGLKGVFTDFTV